MRHANLVLSFINWWKEVAKTMKMSWKYYYHYNNDNKEPTYCRWQQRLGWNMMNYGKFKMENDNSYSDIQHHTKKGADTVARKTCWQFFSGFLTGQLFSKLPLSGGNVSFHAVRICRNKVCDKPGTIWLSNLSLFDTMPVLSGNCYSLMEKWFHYTKPSAWRSLGFETQPLNQYFLLPRSKEYSEIPGSSMQGYSYLSSPPIQQSALCPRRFELGSALLCMGTQARRQMQYFPEYFCQNPGLWKQNTAESQQACFNQLNICQQAKCWSLSRQGEQILSWWCMIRSQSWLWKDEQTKSGFSFRF